jgi:hypothetical protein
MTILAWHFIGTDRLMAHTGTPIVAGETYRVDGPVILCEHGLHASERIIDALYFAPGPIVCRVAMSGEIVTGDNKCAATKRRVIWMDDATDILRAFARQCAMDVAHLWDMPDVVRQYLTTGDESRRDAAWAAAKDAAWAAAWAAARDAAWAAAWSAARAAAWAAAWDAAWAAARDAARDEINSVFEENFLELLQCK